VNHIVLIACASSKQDEPAPARELYQSSLFRKSLAYAEQELNPDAIYVLSAKHHLLPLDQEIAPYDRTLNRMSADRVRAWADEVLDELRRVADLDNDRFTVLAGKKYRKHLVPHLSTVEVPLDGMRIGEQLSHLNEALADE
jgi:hypothetical protein